MFKDCSDFQAGSEILSKGRFDALDETAISGISCKHGFSMKFLNLKGGERYLTAIPLYQIDFIQNVFTCFDFSVPKLK